MKKQRKLSFSELEKEMNVVSNIELKSCLGGWRGRGFDPYDDYVWDLGWIDEVVVYGGGGRSNYDDFWRDFRGSDPSEDDYYYGGGYSQDNDPGRDPIKLPADKLPKMCGQIAVTGECSILAFNYVSKFFGGDKKGIHMSDFAESIEIDSVLKAARQFYFPDESGLVKGVSNENYNTIANTFFENKNIVSGDIQGIENSLKEGKPIIANYGRVDSNNNLDGHAVVIIGYDPNTNEVTIADSIAKDGVRTVSYDKESFHNQKAIEGMKEDQDIRKYQNNQDWWTECGKLGN